MGSSNLNQLGMCHVVGGYINGTQGTDAVLTTNDGAASLTVNGTGDFTVTFDPVFNSAPYVSATVVDATFATTAVHTVSLVAVATNTVQFNAITKGTATTTALADLDFHFMAIGSRNM